VPRHLDGFPIWNAVVIGETTGLLRDEGVGRYGKGFYETQFAEAFGRARRAHADDYPATLKLTVILGQYLADEHRSRYYARGQNLRRTLRGAYDEALAGVDVLAMPTTLQTAHEQRDDLGRLEIIDRALNMLPNTAPFDVTGHPALSVPAGESDRLPVGLMFVGGAFEDGTVLRAGHAYERAVGWDL
jgi:amidase